MSGDKVTTLILDGLFAGCLATLVFGAVVAISSARLIRSVCGLAICCIGLAGLYYFLHSPFLALMEILIYVGAVCVTIVFAVMLAEPNEPARTEGSGSTVAWGGLALATAGCLFACLLLLGARGDWGSPGLPVNDGSIAAIGRALLTTYSMAFELISLALLVAILGALAIARAGRSPTEVVTADKAAGFDLPRAQRPDTALIGSHSREGERAAGPKRDLVTT